MALPRARLLGDPGEDEAHQVSRRVRRVDGLGGVRVVVQAGVTVRDGERGQGVGGVREPGERVVLFGDRSNR